MRVRVPLKSELPVRHPCRTRATASGSYYDAFVEPVRYALSLENEVLPWGGPAPGYLLWAGDRIALVDYADAPQITHASECPEADCILKMKYLGRYQAEYDASPIPVIPAGYVLADAPWVLANLDRLRASHDAGGHTVQVQSRGLFQPSRKYAKVGYSARQVFRDANPKLVRPSLPRDAWMDEVAKSRFGLHVSGVGGSIDRKFVQFAAIGVPVLASKGIFDLILPGGRRLIEGVDAYRLEDGEDVLARVKRITDSERTRSTAALRSLFDTTFHPKALARRYLEQMALS